MTNATTPAIRTNQLRNAIKYIYKNRSAYLFISPFFIGFAIFGLYPLLFSIYLSFTEFKFRAPIVWVGLENYKDILTDHNFLVSVTNTLILWGGTLPVQIVLAFFIASIINTFIKKRMKGVFSGLFYLPEVTNLVAVALVFQLIFDNKYGISNYLLSLLGLPEVPWLISEPWARVSTMLLIIWRGTGWYIVFILAALQSINKEYYEVALVEGANAFQRAWYITIPILKPIFLYLIVMGTIAGWQIFTEPYLLMRGVSLVLGGPGQAVLTPSMLVYEKAFVSLKFGYASAVSTLIGVAIAGFSALYFKVFREK
jgi:cellobiose transport system permease protein